MQPCPMPLSGQSCRPKCPFMQTPSPMCAGPCMSQAHPTVLHVGSMKSIRMQCSQSKHHTGNASILLTLVEQHKQHVAVMLVLLLLVLLFSSPLSDTGLPFRLVFRGACVYMSLPADDLGFVAQRLCEASVVSQGPSGTCPANLHEVSAVAFISTTAGRIAT